MKRKRKYSKVPSADWIVSILITYIKKVQKIPSKGEFFADCKSPLVKNWQSAIQQRFGGWKVLMQEAAKSDKYVSQLLALEENSDNEKKAKQNRELYLKRGYWFCKENGRFPTESDLWSSIGVDLKTINLCFGDMDAYKKEINTEYRKELRHFVDKTIWTPERIDKTRRIVSASKTIFCTSAVAGADVDTNFLKSIKAFCRINKAELVVFPINGELNELSSELVDDVDVHVAFRDIPVTSNFLLSSIKIRANQIDPATSIHRSLSPGMSAVYGATKQRMTTKPASRKTDVPPYAVSTGCVTLPHYVKKPRKRKDRDTGEMVVVETFDNTEDRLNYIAAKNHMLGGVIVEIDKDGTVFTRVVQAYEDGSFADLDKLYDGDSETGETCSPAAIVLGDIHLETINEQATSTFLDASKKLGIKTAIVEDIFDGYTINHHEQNNMIRKALVIDSGRTPNLETELIHICEFFRTRLLTTYDNIIVVKSNHDMWLDEYIQNLLFKDHPQNLRLGLELGLVAYERKNPLEQFVKDYLQKNKVKPEQISKIKFLTEGEDYMISGVNVGHHGHRGPNGARGSMRGLEQALPRAVTAHIHTAEIYGRHHRVGCLADRNQEYTKGDPATSWSYTSGIVHAGGAQQLITCIRGRIYPSWRKS